MRTGPAGAGQLADQLARVPRELRASLRPALRTAGEAVRDAAAANASWSTRIPRSLQVQALFSVRSAGVVIRARRAVAPHARPYEGRSGSTFRHPVFGNRDRWVSARARPFLLPALRSRRSDVIDAAQQAIDTAYARAGIR